MIICLYHSVQITFHTESKKRLPTKLLFLNTRVPLSSSQPWKVYIVNIKNTGYNCTMLLIKTEGLLYFFLKSCKADWTCSRSCQSWKIMQVFRSKHIQVEFLKKGVQAHCQGNLRSVAVWGRERKLGCNSLFVILNIFCLIYLCLRKCRQLKILTKEKKKKTPTYTEILPPTLPDHNLLS